ncbi:MAG: C-terminal helicase domain-containing protein [Desulfobacterales bacterium]|nr:C-terminal helicase domain-containing protein [Desulfobacterales bacterium]
MDDFREGRVRYLVTSDLGARGMDVKGIDYVLCMDLPEEPTVYMHRAGRTGRAGEQGVSVLVADIVELKRASKVAVRYGFSFQCRILEGEEVHEIDPENFFALAEEEEADRAVKPPLEAKRFSDMEGRRPRGRLSPSGGVPAGARSRETPRGLPALRQESRDRTDLPARRKRARAGGTGLPREDAAPQARPVQPDPANPVPTDGGTAAGRDPARVEPYPFRSRSRALDPKSFQSRQKPLPQDRQVLGEYRQDFLGLSRTPAGTAGWASFRRDPRASDGGPTGVRTRSRTGRVGVRGLRSPGLFGRQHLHRPGVVRHLAGFQATRRNPLRILDPDGLEARERDPRSGGTATSSSCPGAWRCRRLPGEGSKVSQDFPGIEAGGEQAPEPQTSARRRASPEADPRDTGSGLRHTYTSSWFLHPAGSRSAGRPGSVRSPGPPVRTSQRSGQQCHRAPPGRPRPSVL